ncbi:hypothetical protein BKA67DRAFT_558530 [Truncatella angustata]|uniref:RING-type domain-containing protein n=1 Tax=Truncatella angustata TaxID=152316 RepID=A0A9P9A1Z6_9PEZI|nr:uncharacterized protein BKA67DRAFT_558530 [Truncatella angustata]KAH6658609.1 hypothetical protein BKA67DRAFT_558530 [Truncatella angustata]
MVYSTWLELQSGAPGLGGPFLLEHLVPYESFRKGQEATPSVVVAIGGLQKRRFLQQHFFVSHVSLEPNIRMGYQPGVDSILLDCELHTLTHAPRIKAGITPGCNTRHELHCGSGNNANEIAHSLYNHILMPLATVTFLFVADLGGWDSVTNLLGFWARRPVHEPEPTPAIVILVSSDHKCQTSVRDVILHASTRLLEQLRLSEPARPFTRPNAEMMIQRRFTIKILNRCATNRDTRAATIGLIEAAAIQQRQSQPAFSTRHLIYLLRVGLVHYSESPGHSFNSYLALRQHSRVPPDVAHCLQNVLRSVAGTLEEKADIIASALWLDAFPPGMHCFSPDIIFSNFYATNLGLSNTSFENKGLKDVVKTRLIELVRTRFIELVSSQCTDHLTRHIAALNSSSTTVSTCGEICVICFARTAMYTFDCQHRICNTCALNIGEQREPWEVSIQRCPVCRRLNTADFMIRPPTAGLRLLQLGGSDFAIIWSFLSQLKKMLNLGSLPFCQFFDGIIAEGAGIYFALSLFLEKWSMKDCKKHLSSNFLPEVHNGTSISHRMLAWMGRSPDITIKYNGGSYSDGLVDAISSKLISSLFYIELITVPVFRTVPAECTVRLLCRVNPGPTFMNLLMELHQRQTCIQYRSADSQFTETPIFTKKIWSMCSKGIPFAKELDLDVVNMDSLIEVKLDSRAGSPQNISNCPYRIIDLIQDQKLDVTSVVPGFQAESEMSGTRDEDLVGGDTLAGSMTRMYRVLNEL